jgi:hypothetical protein
LLAATLSAAGILCGCAAASPPPEPRCCGEILAESFCRNKPQEFTRPLSGAMKKEFGENEFKNSLEKVCRAMGNPVRKQFIGKLTHPFLDIDLWKITFERKTDRGKTIVQDALFQVVSVNEDGESKVISFGFL